MGFDSTQKLKFCLASFCMEPFEDIIPPKILAVSQTFWRDYTCPPVCGGCCKPFSMDLSEYQYQLLLENYPEKSNFFEKRKINIFGNDIDFYSNYSEQKKIFDKGVGQKCQFLDKQTGRCGIYLARPLLCRLELNKFIFRQKESRVIIQKKLFGRGWAFSRVDNGRGALCEMVQISEETIKIVKERDIPLFEQLIKILNDMNINNKGNLFLDILSNQYEMLIRGLPIKPITLVEHRKELF